MSLQEPERLYDIVEVKPSLGVHVGLLFKVVLRVVLIRPVDL